MILVNSVGGTATTMFLEFLEKVVPFPEKKINFYRFYRNGECDYNQKIKSPKMASSLFYINDAALRHLHYLISSREDNIDSAIKQAEMSTFVKLKHIPHPPPANIKSSSYGVLSWEEDKIEIDGKVQTIHQRGFWTVDDDSATITKAIYLHADPIDILSTLFLKRETSGWDATIHDHIIKCSPYSYMQLLKIFEDFLVSWGIEDFSNWVYKNQLDPFGIEYSFDQWTTPSNNEYPIMVVKYETMWDNLPVIAKFLNVDVNSFVTEFPKKRKRKRFGKDLDQTTFNKLNDFYSTLVEKRLQVPDIFITK